MALCHKIVVFLTFQVIIANASCFNLNFFYGFVDGRRVHSDNLTNKMPPRAATVRIVEQKHASLNPLLLPTEDKVFKTFDTIKFYYSQCNHKKR